MVNAPRIILNFRVFLAISAFFLCPAQAVAAPVTLHGVTFAEASENVRLVGVTGSGTLTDPFVMVEEIIGSGDAIVEIDVHSVEFGSRVATFHRVGFALVKVVINRNNQLQTLTYRIR